MRTNHVVEQPRFINRASLRPAFLQRRLTPAVARLPFVSRSARLFFIAACWSACLILPLWGSMGVPSGLAAATSTTPVNKPVGAAPSPESAQEPAQARVCLEAASQDVRQVLQQLATAAGANLVVDDTVNARITLRLQNVPFEQALQIIAQAANTKVTVKGGVYVVLANRTGYGTPQPSTEAITVQVIDLSQADYTATVSMVRSLARPPNAAAQAGSVAVVPGRPSSTAPSSTAPESTLEITEFPELQAVAIRGPYSQVAALRAAVDSFLRARPVPSSGAPQVLKVVPLSYADPYDTASAVQGQFANVRVVPVRGSNSLVVTGPGEPVAVVVAAIESLDRSPALIAFEVEMVEVDSDSARSLGVDWLGSQGAPILSVNWKEAEPTPILGQQKENLIDWRPWLRTSLQVVTQLKMLEEQGHAKVLARPSLTTLENKTARIITGDRFTLLINQNSGGGTWQQIQYIDAGVRLELTPRLDAHGSIVVQLLPQVSTITGYSREGYPIMSTREAQTTVRLKDGETLVIGGLIRDESSTDAAGLPGLSQIPVLRALFGSKQERSRRTELVILVTPRVVKDAVVLPERQTPLPQVAPVGAIGSLGLPSSP